MHIQIDDHNDVTPLIDVQINIDKALQGSRLIKEERMSELQKLQEEVIFLIGINLNFSCIFKSTIVSF